LHTLGGIEHTSDNALAGNERTGDKSNEDAPVETDRMSSEGSDLGEQMDQLLNGGIPLSHTHGNNNDDLFEDGSTLIDYNGDESDDNRAGDNDGFGVDLSDHPDYLAEVEERGNGQFTTHVAEDNRLEGQPSAASEQATTQEMRHENVMNAEIRHENVMNAEIRHEHVMNAEIRHENVMNAEKDMKMT
jgi:hypothetical protein